MDRNKREKLKRQATAAAVSPQLGLHRIGSTSPCVAGIDDNAHCDLYHFIAHMWYFPS